MKKVFFTVLVLTFSITVFALSKNFKLDTNSFSFSQNNKLKSLKSNFNSSYDLTYSITSENSELEEDIIYLSKKVTYLLLGETNNTIWFDTSELLVLV